MVSWLVLGAAVLCNILGNFFIKRFSIQVTFNNAFAYLQPFFILGMAFFGLGLLLYTRALKEIPISLAYPVMVGASMTALSILAIVTLGERLEFRDALGAFLVLSGIALLSHIA